MRGQDVKLDNVEVTYPNGFTAVHPTDLVIKAGEFFSFLGPSGCGKTTLLRTISGFVAPSSGSIYIGNKDQSGISPNARSTALIFQNLALFPLMSVAENVAFGLEARGVSRNERKKKADELLSMVALTDQAHKKPTELSGGQRQRVAIARALAVEPAVLLLDEPLSALDLKLRQHMRAELKAIQKQTGVTFIYITHDQSEALAMSDRVAVMNEGRIEQVGTGDDIYTNPKTPFVASFVGEVNRFEGRVVTQQNGSNGLAAKIQTSFGDFKARNPFRMSPGDGAHIYVRPENIEFVSGLNSQTLENIFTGKLVRRDLEGPFINLVWTIGGGRGEEQVTMHLKNDGQPLKIGQEMKLGFATKHGLALPQNAPSNKIMPPLAKIVTAPQKIGETALLHHD